MIISILNQKGGCGKTTISTNLASCIHKQGKSVLLVDSDPQGSARDWCSANPNCPIPVVGIDRPVLETSVPKIAKDYEYVIVDGAPSLAKMAVSAIKCSDAVIIPITPSPYDIWASSEVIDLIQMQHHMTPGKPKAAFVITRAMPHIKMTKEIIALLENYQFPYFQTTIGQRQLYVASATQGLSALDAGPRAEGYKEIMLLWKEIEEWIHDENIVPETIYE